MKKMLNKIFKSRQEKPTNPQVINVVGAGEKTGVTSIAFLLGNYLASIGYRVVLVELTEGDSFIKMLEQGNAQKIDKNIYSLNNITYYIRTNERQLINILRASADYFILDSGTMYSAAQEIKMSDINIVVGLGCEWRVEELIRADKYMLRNNKDSLVKYVVNLAAEGAAEYLAKRVEREVIELQFSANRRYPNANIRQALQEIVD